MKQDDGDDCAADSDAQKKDDSAASPNLSADLAELIRGFKPFDFHLLKHAFEPAIEPVEHLIFSLAFGDAEKKRLAAEGLAKTGAPAVPDLIGVLKDLECEYAADALGKIGDPRAVEPLIDALTSDGWVLPGRAALALGRIGDVRAVEPLIAALNGVKHRHQVAQALGMLKDKRAVEPLINAVKSGDSLLHQYATEALGNFGDAAVEPLVAALKEGSSVKRMSIANSLKLLGWQPTNKNERIIFAIACKRFDDAAKEGADAVEPLIDALKDRYVDVLQGATGALGIIADTRAVEPLLAKLNCQDPDLCRGVIAALGRIRDLRAVEPLIATLKDHSDRLYGPSINALVNIGSPAVPYLIDALNDSDLIFRRHVVEALGKIGDDRAVEPLIPALKDSDAGVRWSAVNSLKLLNWHPSNVDQRVTYAIASERFDEAVKEGANAVTPLIAALRDSNSGIRKNAADALGEIGDARAVNPLIDLLKNYWYNQQSDLRANAATALVKFGVHSVDSLIPALKDQESKVRKYAARALGEIGDVRAVEPLNDALKDADLCVREEVAKAIGLIGNRRSVMPLIEALKVETSYMRRQDESLRRNLIASLGQCGDSRSLESLINVIKDDGIFAVCDVAAEALIRIGPPAVEALISALKNNVGNSRYYAAKALGKIGDRRAVEPLISVLKSKAPDVRESQSEAFGRIASRKAAAEALGEIGDTRAVAPLIAALNDGDSELRKIAVDALGKIGGEQSISALCTIAFRDNEVDVGELAANCLAKMGDFIVHRCFGTLTDSSSDVRMRATSLLRSVGWQPSDLDQRITYLIACKQFDEVVKYGIDAVPLLIRALEYDPDASEALVSIGEPAVVDLCKSLNDAGPIVRDRTASVLGNIGDIRAVEPLCAALSVPDVAGSAAYALGKIRDARAVDALIKALNDKKSYVRKNAAQALGKIKDSRGVEPLCNALKDMDENVRKEACDALLEIPDPRSVGALLEIFGTSKADKKLSIADLLKNILTQFTSSVRTTDLQRILLQSDWFDYWVWVGDDGFGYPDRQEKCTYDFFRVKERARTELASRDQGKHNNNAGVRDLAQSLQPRQQEVSRPVQSESKLLKWIKKFFGRK